MSNFRGKLTKLLRCFISNVPEALSHVFGVGLDVCDCVCGFGTPGRNSNVTETDLSKNQSEHWISKIK